MIYADGVALMEEYLELETYFDIMNISKEHWTNVIQVTEELLTVK